MDFAPLVAQLQRAVATAREGAAIRRDADADALWCDEYVRFPAPSGALGNVTTRGEAHVLRLAVLYAVADQSTVVRLEHLEAALEVWRYCFESARHLFGHATGDRLADRLFELLPEQPTWITRTAIRDALGRRGVSTDIDRALSQLQARGLATTETDRTGAGCHTQPVSLRQKRQKRPNPPQTELCRLCRNPGRTETQRSKRGSTGKWRHDSA